MKTSVKVVTAKEGLFWDFHKIFDIRPCPVIKTIYPRGTSGVKRFMIFWRQDCSLCSIHSFILTNGYQ